MLLVAPAPRVVLLWGAGVPRKAPHTPGILGLRKAGVKVSGCSWLWPQLIEDQLEKRNLGRRGWGDLSARGSIAGSPVPWAPISPKVSQCLLSRLLTGFQKQLLELLLVLGAAQFCVGSTWGPPVRQVGRGRRPDPRGSTGPGHHGGRTPANRPACPGPGKQGGHRGPSATPPCPFGGHLKLTGN